MTPLKPYLIRSIYEWIVDNQLTPHLLVNAEDSTAVLPEDFIELPSFDEVSNSKEKFCDMQNLFTNNKNLAQKIDNRYILQYKFPNYTSEDLVDLELTIRFDYATMVRFGQAVEPANF